MPGRIQSQPGRREVTCTGSDIWMGFTWMEFRIDFAVWRSKVYFVGISEFEYISPNGETDKE